MKTTKSLCFYSLLIGLALNSLSCAQHPDESCKGTEKEYYSAVEINNIVCGYSIDRECLIYADNKAELRQTADVQVKLSLLGQGFDLGIQLLFKVDPETRRWFYNKTVIERAGSLQSSTTQIIGDTAYYRGNEGTALKKIPLPPDIQLETSLSFPHLVKDILFGNASEMSYKVFDYFMGEIGEKKYSKIGEEDIVLNDSTYHAVVLEETDLLKGTIATLWFNAEDGFPLQTMVAGRYIYLTNKEVTGKINQVNYDNVIFSHVNKLIPEIQQLSYMKVKARIESFGEFITPASLNRPGQQFTGEVNKNTVDGVFEMRPVRYRGENAPAFPTDYSGNEGLKKYLEPEMLIESDNPAIVSEAKKITEGSKDSWEAALRLSKWVSENIKGAIPGGISAINTYKTREGECSSHSRLLAAFCRAAGIPARLSVGCMYVPNFGGSFGSHAWNEIYMGEAGWIPIDATAFELDYIDAGHIHLGEKATFQPKEMEILDYQIEKNNSE